MNYEKIKNFVSKLRSLPEKDRKTILFSIIAIVALALVFFNTLSTKRNVAKIQESIHSLQPSSFDQKDQNFREDDSQYQSSLPEGEINGVVSDQINTIFQDQNPEALKPEN